MKLFITLVCVIAYVTADAPSQHVLTAKKCASDIVFRGHSVSGSSSSFSDGPYEYAFGRKTFDVEEFFKGETDGEVQVFYIQPLFGDCPDHLLPYSGEPLVFANWNSTYNMYELSPCFQNPSVDDVDLDFFRNIAC